MWAAVILGKTMSRQRFNLNLSQHQFCFLFFLSSTQRLVWPFTLNLSQHNLFLFFFSSTQGWVWPFGSSASSPSWPISSFLASYSQIQSYCIRWVPITNQVPQRNHKLVRICIQKLSIAITQTSSIILLQRSNRFMISICASDAFMVIFLLVFNQPGVFFKKIISSWFSLLAHLQPTRRLF